MRFLLTLSVLALAPMAMAAALAQGSGEGAAALQEAKARAAAAADRAEDLRQEAATATDAADRLTAQRAAMSAEIDGATAEISAANARLAIIAKRNREQRRLLAIESEPMLRLNSALQAMTARPSALLFAQPGSRADYVHLRAVMATVRPEIEKRTASIRSQIAAQNELRRQQMVALKSLKSAQGQLGNRRTELAKLESVARGKAGGLSATAAVEYEQAIAQGERARDLVAALDTDRTGQERATSLAALDGPVLRPGSTIAKPSKGGAYVLPEHGELIFGYKELNATGYRERGIRLTFEPGEDITAPAAGRISYAGPYRSYGNIIIIEHGSGWTTLMTNLGEIGVVEGDRVAQGGQLATARDDNSEITVELRRNGRIMDIVAMLI